MLLEKLEEKNLTKNTVIVGFTDHYAYGFPQRELLYKNRDSNDPNFLNRTPFFIWARDLQSIEIDTISSAIDIYPTLVNLFFGEKDERLIFLGTDILSNYHRATVFFDNGAYLNKDVYYNPSSDGVKNDNVEQKYAEKKQIEDVNNAILLSDYFRNK